MRGLDYYMDGLLHEYLNQPEGGDMTLPPSDEAFIKAYAHNVASAPEEIVRKFLEMDDHTKFYEQHWEYYASIADAYGMWNDTLAYVTTGEN